jgi:hypothetical protein
MDELEIEHLRRRIAEQRAEAGRRITAARAVLADALAGVKSAEEGHTRLQNDLQIVERELLARQNGGKE